MGDVNQSSKQLVAHLPPKDWNDAYDNRGHTPNVEQYTVGWSAKGAAFRSTLTTPHELNLAYGPDERHRYDLFWPHGGSGSEKGLVIFVHGGYWVSFSKEDFSQLAAGPLTLGWVVAVVSYRLAPQARISEITKDVAMAINALGSVGKGPLRLVGHSVGGSLVSRMMCTDVFLDAVILGRLDRVISVSGLHDLRPILRLDKNEQMLHLDDVEARLESPVLCTPRTGIPLVAVVGDKELPEFIRQSRILPLAWQGMGAECYFQVLDEENHYTIVEQLEDARSQLCSLLNEQVLVTE